MRRRSRFLAADPYARVGLGPKRTMTAADLRASVDEGRVPDIVQWLPAVARDVFVVPAGTIHAIGPGLVIVEIQQRSDLTYRLFDHGRSRGLQVEKALAIASLSPAAKSVAAIEMSDGRSAIAVTPFFVLERLKLAVGSSWQVEARRETWVLVLEGEIEIAGVSGGVGQAIFLENERAVVVVGVDDVVLLIAYGDDRPEPDLLRPLPATPGFPTDEPAPIGAALSRREPAATPAAATDLLP
jgi:mannose-6-phosphate isomerase